MFGKSYSGLQRTCDNLVGFCIKLLRVTWQVKERAVSLAKALENEDGVEGAVRAFFRQLSRRKLEPEPQPQKSSLLFIRKCFGCCWTLDYWVVGSLFNLQILLLLNLMQNEDLFTGWQDYSESIMYYNCCKFKVKEINVSLTNCFVSVKSFLRIVIVWCTKSF